MRRNLAGPLLPELGGNEPLSIHEKAKVNAEELLAIRNHLQESWQKTQDKVKSYYDHHHESMDFAVDDWVMLFTKNLQLRKASKKLSNKFIGPFRVAKRISKNAYQLNLLKEYGRVHPTFHVLLL